MINLFKQLFLVNLFKRNFSTLIIFVLTLSLAFSACSRGGGKGSRGGDDGTYEIDIIMEDNQGNDSVDVTPDIGSDGDAITINYTVANIKTNNLLYFSGVGKTIEPVDKAEDGTRTYTVNPNDAIDGVITITARFTHTDLTPDPIEFTKNSENKIYGDSPFTNAIKDYNGTGAITYSSSDESVATVDVNTGEVTILKTGSTTITATKAADYVYAEETASYTLTVAQKGINLTVTQQPAKIFTPLESDSPAYSERTDTFEVSVTGLIDSDKVKVNITGYGLSVEDNTGIDNNTSKTITLKYDGTTTVTQITPINVTLTLSSDNFDSTNYAFDSAAINVTIYDGQTEDRPIPVKNANIKTFNSYANTIAGLTRHYKLAENITLPNVGAGESNWIAIGSSYVVAFTGSFDGDNKKITGLTINNPSSDYQGMFGYINDSNAVVKNLGLEEDNIIGNNNVGGVVGGIYFGTVQNCYATGNVTGNNNVGGVVGANIRGTVQNCYATGNVTGNVCVGGVVGGILSGTAQNCYATGNVTGNSYVGGVVGLSDRGTVQDCVALSTTITRTSGSNSNFGRVAGYSYNIYTTLSNNYANSSMQAIGGFTFAGTNAHDGLDGADFTDWESVVGWETFHSSKAAATAAIESDPNDWPWWFSGSGNPKLWFED